MISADVVNLFRVSVGFLVVFGALPCLVALNSRREHVLVGHCAAFMRTTLFTEIVTLVLGSMRLCLPGSVGAAYVLFLLALMFRSGTLRNLGNSHWLRAQLHKLILLADGRASVGQHLQSLRIRCVSWRRRFDRTAVAPFGSICWFAVFVALAACFYPLHNVRFLHGESYSRTLALQKLSLGESSPQDSSVALLAPVVFLSGCEGATVVRFAGPLFAALLALTASVVLFQLTGSSAIGMAGAGLIAGFGAFADGGQLQADGIASIFVLLSILLWRASRLDAVWSMAAGLLIDPIPGLSMIWYVGIPLVIALLVLSWRSLSRYLAMIRVPIALMGIACLIYLPAKLGGNEGPYQYETAARAVSRITRELPQNTWLVVSPVQELAFTYGHGWHMELSDFVNKYNLDQVIQPDFHFGFPVMDTFVFVEKRPLVSRALGLSLAELGTRFEPAIAPYQLRLSRASLEFEAGRLLAAYRARHSDVQVFVEDENVVVYRIRSSSGGARLWT